MASFQEMSQMVDNFTSSGKTRIDFCKEHGIKPATFSYWLKRVREQGQEPLGGFAKVILNKMPVNSCHLEITFPNQVSVKVASSDLSLISALIRLY